MASPPAVDRRDDRMVPRFGPAAGRHRSDRGGSDEGVQWRGRVDGPQAVRRDSVRQQARGPYGPQARSPFPPSVSGEMTALTSPNSTITASRAELPPPGTLGIEIRPRRERVVVAPRGELDCGTTDRLEAAKNEFLAIGWDSIVIDLSGSSFMDST